MLPIRDVNPTAIRPLLTWLIVAVNLAVFFLIQPQTGQESEDFAYRHAAIACELTTGEALDFDERQTGVCRDTPGAPAVFPEKP